MPEIVRFAIAVLACYRIAQLVTLDDGPGDCLLTARATLGGYDLGEDGRPETSLGRGIICPHCVGVWVAAVLAVTLFPLGLMTPVYWLAIAGGQSFLQSVGGRT